MTGMGKILVFCSLLQINTAWADSLFAQSVDLKKPAQDFSLTVQKLRQVQRLRASFEQRKHMKVLSRPFISQGRMVFDAVQGLYWQIDRPVQSRYVINTKGIRPLAVKDAGKPLPMSADIGQLFTAIFTVDMRALGKLFQVFYAVAPDSSVTTSVSRWRIGLKPVRADLGKVIESIEFSGEESIQMITIRESNGDSTDIVFSDLNAQPAALSEAEIAYFNVH